MSERNFTEVQDGRLYRTQDGTVVKAGSRPKADPGYKDYPFKAILPDGSYWTVTSEGYYMSFERDSEFDLIEELPDEDPPEALAEAGTTLTQVAESTTDPDLLILQEALSGSRGEDQKLIALAGLEITATLLRKNRDYGCSVWKRPFLAPNCDPGAAIRVRMTDKIERIRQLTLQGTPEVAESLRDTFKDLAGYSILEYARPENYEHNDVSIPDPGAGSN